MEEQKKNKNESKPNKAKEKEKEKYGFSTKVGQEISIAFLDGKVLKGKLTKVLQYEIILEVDLNGKKVEATAFKGAVKYII